MNYIDMQENLKRRLRNNSRYMHSIGVSDTAVKLAEKFNVSAEKAKIAGLLHDCAREFSTDSLISEAEKRNITIEEIDEFQPILLHAVLGAVLAREQYGVTDGDILSAISLHTTGKPDMTALDKVVYLADMIEPHRKYDDIERIRRMIDMNSLDDIMIAAFDASLSFVIQKGQMIHPQTVMARNFLIAQQINHG